MNVQVANRLIELRKRKGLSQEELADVLGVSRQAVSKWERTEASPDTDNLIALAKFYNVSLDELLDTSTPVDDVLNNKEKEEPSKKEAKISGEGVFLKDDDGSFVHISKEGITIKDADDDEEDDKHGKTKEEEKGFKFKDIDSFKNYMHRSLIENILHGSMALFVTIAYIILGVTCSNMTFGVMSLNAWAVFWPMFILAPVPASLCKAIRKRNPGKFNFVFLVTGVYCFLGMFLDLWHPFWFLFLLIPAFYSVNGIIRKHLLFKKADKIISKK